MWCGIDGGGRWVEPVVQMEVGIDVFRDGPEWDGRTDSKESINGTIASLVAFGRAGCSKCYMHIGGRA